MTVRANLTVAGITKGKSYDVIEKSGKHLGIILDNGTIGLRHIGAFDIIGGYLA